MHVFLGGIHAKPCQNESEIPRIKLRMRIHQQHNLLLLFRCWKLHPLANCLLLSPLRIPPLSHIQIQSFLNPSGLQSQVPFKMTFPAFESVKWSCKVSIGPCKSWSGTTTWHCEGYSLWSSTVTAHFFNGSGSGSEFAIRLLHWCFIKSLYKEF